MQRASSPKLRLIPLAAALIATASAALIGSAATSDVHGVALVGGKPQANVVVWVDVPAASKEMESNAVLEQRNLDFSPRVVAVRVGSIVKFPNYDRVFHNVFSFHNGKKFDLGLYPTGTVKNVTFDKAGVSRLFCNIHPHMAAYVVAVDSSYIAISDASGRFTLRGVPAGTDTYQAWRPGAETIKGSAAMTSDTQLEVRWP
jgi:plastocyanin